MAETDNEPPLVDTHFHIYTTDLPLAPNAWHKPPEDAGAERLIKLLDEHGIALESSLPRACMANITTMFAMLYANTAACGLRPSFHRRSASMNWSGCATMAS